MFTFFPGLLIYLILDNKILPHSGSGNINELFCLEDFNVLMSQQKGSVDFLFTLDNMYISVLFLFACLHQAFIHFHTVHADDSVYCVLDCDSSTCTCTTCTCKHVHLHVYWLTPTSL